MAESDFHLNDFVKVIVPGPTVVLSWTGYIRDWEATGVTLESEGVLTFYPWAMGCIVQKKVSEDD